MRKKATAQIAHLVFADTKANAKKPKELFFANALKGIKNLMKQDKRKHSKLQCLKTGLIQYLLSGMVRVNHLIKETTSV